MRNQCRFLRFQCTAGRIKRLLCRFSFLLLGLATLSSLNAAEGNDNTKIISGILDDQPHAMAEEVLRVAYGRMGYKVKFELFPGIRSLELANKGETDGDIARISGTQKEFPNLRPLATPVIHIQGVAFTKSVTRKIKIWGDLEGLRIGVIRGIRYSTIGTEGLNRYFAEDTTHLFRLLADDRIQIAVAVLDAGRIELHKNFKDSGIHVVGSPLYEAPLFHFVHKKNEYLIGDLNRILQDMAAHREIDRILNAAMIRLMNK